MLILRAVAVETRKVVKPSGSLLVFCDWRMVASLAPAIESASLRFQNIVVWNKGEMGLGTGFRNQHELIMHFTYGEPKYYNKGESNVLTVSRVGRDDREHQTQKPLELIKRLLSVVSPTGGRVLDCFMGSGQTGIACAGLGIRFVGAEHDPEYYYPAARRIRSAYDDPFAELDGSNDEPAVV